MSERTSKFIEAIGTIVMLAIFAHRIIPVVVDEIHYVDAPAGVERAEKFYFADYESTFFALPLKCDGNNVMYSDDSIEIRNMKFLSSEEDEYWTYLTYSGEVEVKDDYFYNAISMTFGVGNKKGDLYAPGGSPGTGWGLVSEMGKGDVKEFEFKMYVAKGQVENGNATKIFFLGRELM